MKEIPGRSGHFPTRSCRRSPHGRRRRWVLVEDADAPRTELYELEQVTQGPRIFRWEILLAATVCYTDCLRDVRLSEYVAEPFKAHVFIDWLAARKPLRIRVESPPTL